MTQQKKQRILLLNICGEFGGGAVHIINQYKALLKRNHDVTLLVAEKSKTCQALENNKLPYLTSKILPWFALKILGSIGLFIRLYTLCKKEKFNIIHCNLTRELWACKMVARFLPVKIIFTKHKSLSGKPSGCKGFDGIIGVSRSITDSLESYNNRYHLGFKNITTILPFFDETKFQNVTSTQTRQDFFKNTYDISIKNVPIICTIACFNTDKNHRILLQALHKLIHLKHKSIQLMLVGNGRKKDELKTMVATLNLQDYVHFLGFTDQTPAILFHSDIHVLPSKREALGIANLEAALMKKPILGATKTGAESIIIHENNGLLFENDNANDLAIQIERLLDKPQWAIELGLNAHQNIICNFSEAQKIAQLEQFYDRIMHS